MLRGKIDWILQFFFLAVFHPQALKIIFNTTFRLTEIARQRMERMRERLDQTKENDIKKAAEERKMQKKIVKFKKNCCTESNGAWSLQKSSIRRQGKNEELSVILPHFVDILINALFYIIILSMVSFFFLFLYTFT